MNQLSPLQLWHLYKYVELTEVVTQIDQTFLNVLNSFCFRIVNENNEKLLKTRFTDQSDTIK